MSLVDVIRVFRIYWRSAAAVFVVVSAAAVGLLMLQPAQYTSSATVYLIPRSGGAAGQLSAAQEYAVTQSKTFAGFVESPAVMEPVHTKLGLGGSGDSLIGRVTAFAPGETASIVIRATDRNPQFAHDLVAATADQLLVAFREYTAPGAEQVLEAKIMQPASLPMTQSSPDLQRNVLLALAIGVAVGVAQAFVRSYLNNNVESPDDVARVTERRIIGEIPNELAFSESHGSGRKMSTFSQRAESYRRLRTNLQFLTMDHERKSLLVTSSIPGEGKTETASAIAETMADSGARVLLIDADLRRPQVAKLNGLENEVGLTSVLLEGLDLRAVVQQVGGFDVLTSGPIPPNPSELLGTDQMGRLLETAAQQYDFVVVDTPPVLPVTDATVLARTVGGVVLVADTQNVKRGQLKHALTNLDGIQANVLGIVLNKIRTTGGRYGHPYGYGYGYAYSFRYEYGSPGSAGGRRGKRSAASAKSRTHRAKNS